MFINIFNMLFKLISLFIVLCLPTSGMVYHSHGNKTAALRILEKGSFGLNKSRDNTFEESPGFKVPEIRDIKQDLKLKNHNEHEKKSININRRSIPLRFSRSRIPDNDKRFNASSSKGLAHLAKSVISDIKKLEDKYQVSVSGVAKIHQRMINNFGNYTWRHASLPGGGAYISQHVIAPSKSKISKHKSLKTNLSHDKRVKFHKKEKIVVTTNPPTTFKSTTYKPQKIKTTDFPKIPMVSSTTKKPWSYYEEEIFGSRELADTSTPNIDEEPTVPSQIKHPAKKYIFNNDEFDSEDTYEPSQFRLRPHRYHHHFYHDFKPLHYHHFSRHSETSTRKIYPSSYVTTDSYDQTSVLKEKGRNMDSIDATPVVEFESNGSDDTSTEKNIKNGPKFDDVDEPPVDIASVPSPMAYDNDKKLNGIPVIELFVSNQSQIVSPKNNNHSGYYLVYDPPEGIPMPDPTPTFNYTTVQESDDDPDTIPQILSIEMIRPESNMDYSESAVYFPDENIENRNVEMDPCQHRGSIQISLLNLGLPCGGDISGNDIPEDLKKREFALNMTNVFYEYFEKEKENREEDTPLDIDIRAGRRRRTSDKEMKKDKKPIPTYKKMYNKDLMKGSVFGKVLNLSNNTSNEHFNLSLLSDYFLEAVDSIDEKDLIEILVGLKDEFLSKSPSDHIIVNEVYDKLIASLLEYKRSKHKVVKRTRRETLKRGRSEAASFLELLAETDRLIDSEQQDDPSINDYNSDNNDPDDDVESNENPSFLELVSLANKHKSRV